VTANDHLKRAEEDVAACDALQTEGNVINPAVAILHALIALARLERRKVQLMELAAQRSKQFPS